jgi:hypothetical protein
MMAMDILEHATNAVDYSISVAPISIVAVLRVVVHGISPRNRPRSTADLICGMSTRQHCAKSRGQSESLLSPAVDFTARLKRPFLFSFLLLFLASGSFAAQIVPLFESRDDLKTRQAIRHRAELKPLADEYTQLIQSLLVPRPLPDIDAIFGPVLRPPPGERVLPVFAPEEVLLPDIRQGTVPNNGHADFHALGEVGFVEFYFGPDGVSVQGAVLYLRADDQFIQLRSGDDFPERLRWEKSRLEGVIKWLNEHLSKP